MSTRKRFAAAGTMFMAMLALAPVAQAQNYGESQHNYNNMPPIMGAPSWRTVERAGQTWDGTWTFTDRDHRTMEGSWVNRVTGQHVYAHRMFVRMNGNQVTVTRPGTGEYVGTLSPDGQSIRGSMSWISGRFTAHA
jgi:hypothetical protein